jgi:hypothetical protein
MRIIQFSHRYRPKAVFSSENGLNEEIGGAPEVRLRPPRSDLGPRGQAPEVKAPDVKLISINPPAHPTRPVVVLRPFACDLSSR